ncbi:MAG TPA: DNA gyrase subunit A, partial [Pyrinomonadaceae bacterium]|nr:DNA gyrase subunit A [Pyrinomonadaceae bacterium]
METLDRNYVNIEDEMRRSYLDYAMSVIIGRALPDVRDGFKPVHRRVLWAMHELGNQHNKAYKKSARIVGDVIGKYHPHGDSAAAMRYTEARMSKISSEVLADIEKETVNFQPNYDESLSEPAVMPTRVPNLLLNGS